MFRLLIVYLLIGQVQAYAEEKVLRVYHDSDYSKHLESAISMKRGIETAFSEIDHEIQGYKLVLIEKNHRGNSIRSKIHFDEFTNDQDALFVLGGLHSPPYIRHLDFINRNQIPLLIPWAAGGPITRYDQGTNWVFRLSIDDSIAGYRIIDHSVNNQKCVSPYLLLEHTPWGQSNLTTMTRALSSLNSTAKGHSFFNWNTKQNQARRILRDIIEKKIDCIVFVGNSVEGAVFTKSLFELMGEKNIKFISHWGITGGDFRKKVSKSIREKINLQFIQTCFSFNSKPLSKFASRILGQANNLFPDIDPEIGIEAPTGFIHSYDLGKVVVQALSQLNLKGKAIENRRAFRDALENIQQPVKGLIKTYRQPFSRWSDSTPRAHEALGLSDYCMGEYNDQGKIILLN